MSQHLLSVIADKGSRIKGSRILVALDYDAYAPCMHLAKQLNPQYCRLKIGKELFTAVGPKIVEDVQALGFDVFLDLKFHDIPNTVAKAIKASASLGVWMVNVHGSGGVRMLEAAKNALSQVSAPPLLIGVTVLTSMDASDLQSLSIQRSPAQQAELLAGLVKDAGLDGIVCSAQEVLNMKKMFGSQFLCVTPGIRPLGSEVGDQRRVMTPELAIAQGCDYLVIGRPITQSSDPAQQCFDIYQQVERALGHTQT